MMLLNYSGMKLGIMFAFFKFCKYLSMEEPQTGFYHMLETYCLAEDKKAKYQINLFLCFNPQNQLFFISSAFQQSF